MDWNRDGRDDAEQVEECVGPRIWRAIKCACRAARAALKGFKTLITCGVLGLVGLADLFEGIDLHTIATYFSDAPRVGSVLIGLAALFAVLRMVSNTKAFASLRGVDEPSDEATEEVDQ